MDFINVFYEVAILSKTMFMLKIFLQDLGFGAF